MADLPAIQSINQHQKKEALNWLYNILVQPSAGGGSGVPPAEHEQYGMSLDLIRQAVVEINDVVNNLSTDFPGKVLDARQGKALADSIQAILDQKAAANGIATLGADGKIPSAQIPSLALVDVFPVESEAAMLALAAEQGDMAIRSDVGLTYILSKSPASTLSNWIELAGLSALLTAHTARTDNPHSVTKAQVGLGDVDNTKDADKPISTAQQDALDLKIDKADIADDYEGGQGKVLSAEKGKDLDGRIKEIEARRVGLYGYKKHKASGTVLPLYDSVELGPMPVIRGSVPQDFSNPYHDIRIFYWRSALMDVDQNILAYYGEPEYDTPTHDSQSYVVEIPAAYFKNWEDEDWHYRVVSEAPVLDGMFIPGCFLDPEGRAMPFAYIDKYRRGLLGGYSVSRPDVLPEVGITLPNAELKAEAISSTKLWTGSPEELDWYITMMAELMTCNTNSQAAYGQGMSNLPYSADDVVTEVTTDSNDIIMDTSRANRFKVGLNVRLGSALGSGQTFADRYITDITDNGNGSSTVTVDGDPFTTVVGYILHAHRQPTTSHEANEIGEQSGFILHNGRSESQVENWFNGIAGHGGNVYEFTFGLLRYDNHVYLCHDRRQFNHNGDPRDNPAYQKIGFYEEEVTSSYIKNVKLIGNPPYVMDWVSETGGSSNSHYADPEYYLNSTYRGTRVVLRRFSWTYGAFCGRRGLSGAYGLSTSDWTFGWRASPSLLDK